MAGGSGGSSSGGGGGGGAAADSSGAVTVDTRRGEGVEELLVGDNARVVHVDGHSFT